MIELLSSFEVDCTAVGIKKWLDVHLNQYGGKYSHAQEFVYTFVSKITNELVKQLLSMTVGRCLAFSQIKHEYQPLHEKVMKRKSKSTLQYVHTWVRWTYVSNLYGCDLISWITRNT